MTNQDSPLGDGNNFFYANAGDAQGWKLFQYDFNGILEPGHIGAVCHASCAGSYIHWSKGRRRGAAEGMPWPNGTNQSRRRNNQLGPQEGT